MGLGAAATNALWDFMAQQEKDRRQKFVDAIAGRAADRADREEARASEQADRQHQERLRQLDLNERAMNIQEAAAKRQAAQDDVAGAKRTAETTKPGGSLDTNQADQMRRANMGGLVRVGVVDPAALEQASVADPALGQVDMGRQFGGREQTYAGDVRYQMGMEQAAKLRAEGNVAAAQFIESQLTTGDTSLPVGAFVQKPGPAKITDLQGPTGPQRYYVTQNPDGTPKLHHLGPARPSSGDRMGDLAAAMADTAFDRMTEEMMVNKLADLREGANIFTTGTLGSGLAWIPGTDANTFRENVVAFHSNVVQTVLNEMRKNAALMNQKGSGLGQVTEREIAMLERYLGALSSNMQPATFQAQSDQLMDRLIRWKEIKAEWKAEQAAASGKKPTGAPAVVAPGAKKPTVEEILRRNGVQ